MAYLGASDEAGGEAAGARALAAAGRELVAELDLDTLLRRLPELARELTGAGHATLELVDRRGREPEELTTGGRDASSGRRAAGAELRAAIDVDGRPYAHLRLSAREGDRLDGSDQDTVAALAGWARIAIGNARRFREEAALRRELERSAYRYEAMREIVRAVGSLADLDRVLEVVARHTRSLVDARAVAVSLIDGDELVVSAVAGRDAEDLLGERVALAGSLDGHALELDRPLHLRDAPPGLGGGVAARFAPRGGLFLPLSFRGRHLGVLAVFDPGEGDGSFGAEDALFLEGIAASAAAGVAIAQGAGSQELRHSLGAAERERQRWARNLHDETLQDLAGLRLTLDALAELRDPDHSATLIAHASGRVRDAIAQLRHLVSELRPLLLDDLGLEAALEALVHRVRPLTPADVGISVRLAYEAGLERDRLSPELEETVYRVVQESLNNAVKHAGAGRIDVEVVERGRHVRVRVSDDGIGFDPESRPPGFGLTGMRERLELVGGVLNVTSRPRAGTNVRATMPVARAEPEPGETGHPPADPVRGGGPSMPQAAADRRRGGWTGRGSAM